jgi:hypothetical protein
MKPQYGIKDTLARTSAPGKNRKRNAKGEKSSSSRMVKGRCSHIEDNGEREERRYEDRKGIEAFARRNHCHGGKARGVPEHAGIGLPTK